MIFFKKFSLIVLGLFVFASHLAWSQSQGENRFAAALAIGEDRDRGTPDPQRKMQIDRDENGRVTRLETSRGEFLRFHYNRSGKLNLIQTAEGFKPLTVPTGDLIAIQLNGKRRAETGVDMLGPGGLPPDCSEAWRCEEDFNQQCAADPTCFAMFDDLAGFIGNLANWLEVGSGLGATIFGTLSVLSGDAAAIVLAELGLGAAVGAGVVIAFAGGYIIGSGLNYVGTWVYNNSGQLVYSGG